MHVTKGLSGNQARFRSTETLELCRRLDVEAEWRFRRDVEETRPRGACVMELRISRIARLHDADVFPAPCARLGVIHDGGVDER